MTVIEAINAVDELKPNSYTQEQKIGWLNILDGRIMTEVIRTHKGAEGTDFEPYTEDDINKELLVGEPYTNMYLRWLEASIDYANGEYGKYGNSMTMFNADYSDWERWYNRTHEPIGVKIKFF